MKYIKSINEYTRTVGFRYSKPSESFHAILLFVGKLDEDSFKSVLDSIDITYESLSIREEEDIIEIEVDEKITEVITNGIAEFDLLIYNEKELDSICDNIKEMCNIEFDVQIREFNIKKNPKNKIK